MFAAILALSLTVDPSPRGARILACGPLLVSHRGLQILPRTAPQFEPLVEAPGSFREEAADDRPRSFAQVACSPSLCDDFKMRERFVRRAPFTAPPAHRVKRTPPRS